ncbi:Endonuclease/exonuclease/phosphatase [Vararia minispora EC-137]|uniref:Endonuclease/exonuclease/phosphatase n=1 Tax=Vararia minispora EC-137 TaxID=1314806 RepID=A0ACB8QY05_9AGAM|nr:Endonuclease/exonuclease/phosphatase [Vararia minispora EC-137]
MSGQPRVLTPEQLALREERRRKRAEPKGDYVQSLQKGSIVPRQWRSLAAPDPGSRSLKILTWNLLAQCLIRRELFPNSDCLRASQREHMTFEELFTPRADVLCLQETDRSAKFRPALDKAGYDYHLAAGPRKKHGCLIAWRRDLFTQTTARVLYYDNENVHGKGDPRFRRGASFRAKNIANIVALKRSDGSGEGFVVATTHLFWHPASLGILQREALRFRTLYAQPTWPILLAGDFNFSPDSPAYALLLRMPLTPTHTARLAASRVVHISVDPTILLTEPTIPDEDAEMDPDRIITNARPARPDDGLLDDAGLLDLYASSPPVRSAYDDGQRALIAGAQTCGARLELDPAQRGAFEPEYTNYTSYWKLTLDYIFVIDPPGKRSAVLGLLELPPSTALEPGLPRKGVSSSDHLSLCAELQWTAEPAPA